MNREILFRGFHECENGTQEIWTSGTCQGEKVKGKIKGEWLEGCYVYDNNLNHHIRAFDNCYYAVIPETVGQYTGLVDKNGIKIFEGDILKVKSFWEKAIGVIIEKTERYDFTNEKYYIDKVPKEKGETYWSVEYKNYATSSGYFVFGINRKWRRLLSRIVIYNAEAVVIGNIYDNKELLEVPNGN